LLFGWLSGNWRTGHGDLPERHFTFGPHVGGRDAKAVRKTVSGLVKLLHLDGNVAKGELAEYAEFALEMRLRVKEQLKKMGGLLITGDPLPVGSVFTIASDPTDRFTVQAVNLNQAKEGAETAIAFFISLVFALLERPTDPTSVVAGEMSVKGVLHRVANLPERLELAREAGAKRVLIPSENKRDLADVPDETLNRLQPVFYTDPINAALRAMGLEQAGASDALRRRRAGNPGEHQPSSDQPRNHRGGTPPRSDQAGGQDSGGDHIRGTLPPGAG